MKKLTRYRVLRKMGFDPVASGLITFANFMMGVPAGVVGTAWFIVEFDPNEEVGD